MTRPRAIEVHIDQLVLHGFDPADGYRIGDALRSELGLLLMGSYESAIQQRTTDGVGAAPFPASQTAPTDGIGAHVAQAVFRSFGA